MMPAYAIEIEHRETDQVFSYYHNDEMLHFNAGLLARMHKQMPNEFRRIMMTIGMAEYDLCIIEEPGVARLSAERIAEPGYGVLFEEGSFTIIDGHHRLVRRYREGRRTMDFYVTTPGVWKHCLIEYTPEYEALLADNMPPKAENPELLPSLVAVHKS